MQNVQRAAKVAAWFVLVLSVVCSWVAFAQQVPNFVGKTEALDASNISTGRRLFEAGARSNWHGAAPDVSLTQVSIGFGGTTKWGEPVSDAIYRGAAR